MRQGKKHNAEEIVNPLREVEVDFANSKTLPQACKKGAIVEQTYYRDWLKVDQAQGLKELQQENAKLKRLASELSLEKAVLKCFPALQGWYAFCFIVTLICLGFATSSRAQSVQLLDAPKPSASLLAASTSVSDSSFTANLTGPSDFTFSLDVVQTDSLDHSPGGSSYEWSVVATARGRLPPNCYCVLCTCMPSGIFNSKASSASG